MNLIFVFCLHTMLYQLWHEHKEWKKQNCSANEYQGDLGLSFFNLAGTFFIPHCF